MMKQLILSACLLVGLHSFASDSLKVVLNGNRFQKGDTLSFDCIYHYTEKKAAASTLNVFIEDIQKTRKWQFRYPLVNGTVSANLAIPADLPDGKYAINFLVQNQFFGLRGKIRDYSAKTKGIVYMMLTKGKDSYIDNVKPNVDGSFSLPRLQFADSARFIFSQVGKKNNDLFIDIATPLDSIYTPAATVTEMVTVGNPTFYTAADTTRPYKFNEDIFKKPFTIEEVVVKSKRKKNVEKFDEEYTTGLFAGGDARIFDGIDGNDIGTATDIFQFLQGRVAGLVIARGEDGLSIKWRGGNVALYLDEFKIDPDDGSAIINPMDVAMIKVFPPNSGGPTNGGAIAVYTKRGDYGTVNASRKYYFIVKGFTPAEGVWR